MYVIVGGHTEIIYFKPKNTRIYNFITYKKCLTVNLMVRNRFAKDVQTPVVHSEYETNAKAVTTLMNSRP